MKKVIVLAAAAALLATPAFAGIRNTKHDLSSSGGQAIRSENVNEVCVFCHTPHGAATGLLAPLWNRSHLGKTYAANELYNSATLESASRPTTVVNAVNESDAKLCMSCHDGASLAGGLRNPGADGQPTFATTGVGNDQVNANANLGTSLTNDHPIGMNYTTVASAAGTTEFVAPSGNLVGGKLPLYTSTNGTTVMWCSSCHDVHDNSKGAPFLNTTNVGSALCTKCHVK